jgi:hypothetical protein
VKITGTTIAVRDIGPSEIIDNDAALIGDLYQKARGSLVDSVRYSIECGERLLAKKAVTPHGQWLHWLEANESVLGFEVQCDGCRTATRLMNLAKGNRTLASDLDEATAIDLSRKTWGHQRPKTLATLQNAGAPNEDDGVIDVISMSHPSDEETRQIYESAPTNVRAVVDGYLSLTREERNTAWQLINLYDQ